VLTVALLAGCSGERTHPELVESLAAQRPARTDSDPVSSSRRTAIVEASQRVSPAVVSITVTSRRHAAPQTPFDFFFLPPSPSEQQSFGTGFIIRSDGVILTNQHVVSGAEKIIVTLFDGTDVPANLVGEDAVTDIAVVRIERKSLPVVNTGKSTDLMIGEWVVALGNPFAYLLGNAEPTVTAGVVSAVHRNILPGRDQSGLYLDMIQTDAAINQGNSGGPLANALGEVIGVNSSILSSSGGSIGLGFAIPIERALRVAEELLSHGSVRRAWTGIDVAGPENLAEWKSQGGALVSNVVPQGPGDVGGLKRGDVLTRANDRALRNYLDWEAVKLDLAVGDPVRLVFRRDDRERSVTLKSGDLPTTAAMKVTVLKDLELVTLTAQVRAERNVQSEQGALIFSISKALSQATGLVQGDVIVGMNRRRIATADEVRAVIEALRSGQQIRIFLERAGQIVYTDLELR
ncbi:MAG TPA: trypsin-like peptidase domain-containing protein, partial [Gemmatimonadales bacterium]|nr:trypsin-like peptidase domain-containing protein [Gemmatimonadales bacterium]